MRGSALRALYRRGLRLWATIHYRHRHRRLVIEQVDDLSLVVLPDVFNPVIFRSSAFLAEQIRAHISPETRYLDMGTGSGIGAIAAAQVSEHVTALDINPEAVRCATINALLNRVEDRVCVLQSDLFAAVTGQRFDVIGFNPPFYCGAAGDAYDHAWRSEGAVARFARSLSAHLGTGGFALVVLSTDGATPHFLDEFTARGLSVQPLAERDLINEIMTVYRLSVA
jgi:methylase of polypeptide subunit release factors